MLERLSRAVHRRPWAFLAVAVAVAAVAAVLGRGVAERLDPYGAEDPATESARSDERLETAVDAAANAGVVALVETDERIASPRLDRKARRLGTRAEQVGDRARELGKDARRQARRLAPDALATQRRALVARERAKRAGARAEAALERARDARSDDARERVKDVERRLESESAVDRVRGYYKTPDASFLSEDRRTTYLLAFLKATDDKAQQETAKRIEEDLGDEPGVTLTGAALANQQVNEQVSHDLERAELLALPLLFVLSLVFFRSLVAALLPPLLGGLSIILTFAALRGASELGSISIFALNLVTGLGLGLAIDYSLFVVSRYREELARVGPGLEALRNTLVTAGRTVLFSSLTVAAALASLLVFPQRFLYSMAVGGVIVSLLAAVVALLVLPAILAVLGPRVNALAPERLQRAAEADARPAAEGFWYRLSRFVMRRPGRIAALSATALIVLGMPFLGIKFIVADEEVLPATASARQADDTLEREFEDNPTTPIRLVLGARPNDDGVDELVEQVEEVPGVTDTSPPEREGPDTTIVNATSRFDALSEPGQEVARDVRELEAPFPVLVGGFSASFVDLKDSLVEHLPMAFGIVVAATLLLLFLMTGSVVLPVKSLLMNVLSLSATFGILVLIFQDGRLETLLDYQSQGALEVTQPILLFAIAFGLSTDYGVFLLSRIKEARDGGETDSESVAVGLERTGRIVTAAALLFSVAIGAFATSEIVFIKEVGVGTALAVLIDATIIRALLVPSLMELLGRWNWWAPRPLRRLHARFGLAETAGESR